MAIPVAPPPAPQEDPGYLDAYGAGTGLVGNATQVYAQTAR